MPSAGAQLLPPLLEPLLDPPLLEPLLDPPLLDPPPARKVATRSRNGGSYRPSAAESRFSPLREGQSPRTAAGYSPSFGRSPSTLSTVATNSSTMS